jgi:hypothetical protein
VHFCWLVTVLVLKDFVKNELKLNRIVGWSLLECLMKFRPDAIDLSVRGLNATMAGVLCHTVFNQCGKILNESYAYNSPETIDTGTRRRWSDQGLISLGRVQA